ncbi:hypothetical protein ACWD60_04215, partial [Streptomyces sp. NPDC005167]
ALAGDQEAAERVELTLPDTGVCGGAVLPCSDLEPRALKVGPRGPSSPSGPPPEEDLPAGADVNPWGLSLERGVLRAGTRCSNKGSIVWRDATAR